MCVNGRYVYNKYTGERLFSKCGHCHACQMEKASSHYSRIMNDEAAETHSMYFSLFVTLNYSNQCLPVVFSSDAQKSVIPVYRHIKLYRGRTSRGHFKTYRCKGLFKICDLNLNPSDISRGYNTSLSGVEVPQKWIYEPNCFGVALSKDFSDFMQRLRMTLRRNYNLDTRYVKFSYFKVQEYGPTTLRPHFHVKINFPASWRPYYYQLRNAVISSWPFCSLRQMRKNVGIAVSGQRYVSQYTCRPSRYPDYFRIRSISQKCSFSRGFGFGRFAFTPSKVLQMLDRRDFHYRYEYVHEGKVLSVLCPVPPYVVRRYFPTFKGRHLLDSKSLESILQLPIRIYSFARYLDIDGEGCASIVRRLRKARRFLGLSPYQYSRAYLEFLRAYPCWRQKVDLLSHSGSWDDYYTNNDDAFLYFARRESLMTDALSASFYDKCFNVWNGRMKSVSDVVNPNNFRYNRLDNDVKEKKFQDWEKKAKLNSYAASLQHEFIEYEIKKFDYGVDTSKTVPKGAFAALRT